MLLPALGSARARGWETNCSSQLKQIYTAFYMYGDDNNERYLHYQAMQIQVRPILPLSPGHSRRTAVRVG
jgi:hypothetical protein